MLAKQEVVYFFPNVPKNISLAISNGRYRHPMSVDSRLYNKTEAGGHTSITVIIRPEDSSVIILITRRIYGNLMGFMVHIYCQYAMNIPIYYHTPYTCGLAIMFPFYFYVIAVDVTSQNAT